MRGLLVNTRRATGKAFCPSLEALEDRQLLSGFQLRLEQSGFAPLTVSDNGPGDVCPDRGVIVFTGAYGTFPVNAITGLSVRGASGEPQLLLNALNMAGPQGGALRILLSDTDVLLPGDGSQPVRLRSDFGGTLFGAGASVAVEGWADAGNRGEAAGVGSGQLSSSSSAFSGSQSTSFTPQPTPYSMVIEARVVLPPGGVQSFGSCLTLSLLEPEERRPDPE